MDTSYNGFVTFSSNDAYAVFPAQGTLVSGVGTFTGVFKTVGTKRFIQAVTIDGKLKGREIDIKVVNGPARRLVVFGYPSPAKACAIGTFYVKAEDAYGNLARDYTGKVFFGSDDLQANLPPLTQFKAKNRGQRTFTMSFHTVGNHNINAYDYTDPTITGTQSGIIVTWGKPSSFVVTYTPPQLVSGTPVTVTVTAVDRCGNTVRDYTGTVTWGATDGCASLPTDYTYQLSDQGVHTFNDVMPCMGGCYIVHQTDRCDIEDEFCGSVLAENVAFRVVRFDTRVDAGDSRDTTWTVYPTSTKQIGTLWNILPPNSFTMTTHWNVAGVVDKFGPQFPQFWTGGNTPLVSYWNVGINVDPQHEVLFNTRVLVAANRDTTWDIDNGAALSRMTKWNAHDIMLHQQAARWNVRVDVADDRDTTWRITVPADPITAAATWNILSQVLRSKPAYWDIAGAPAAPTTEVGRVVNTVWDNAEPTFPVGRTRSTGWIQWEGLPSPHAEGYRDKDDKPDQYRDYNRKQKKAKKAAKTAERNRKKKRRK